MFGLTESLTLLPPGAVVFHLDLVFIFSVKINFCGITGLPLLISGFFFFFFSYFGISLIHYYCSLPGNFVTDQLYGSFFWCIRQFVYENFLHLHLFFSFLFIMFFFEIM